MAAPVVQSLDDILASIQPGYQQQENLYNQQIAAIPGQTDAQVAGLEVGKQNAFRDINRSANSKGMAFSGMPIEEQTRYVGEKYMPAVANLKNDAANKQFTLQQALAGLGTEKRNAALTTQRGQQQALQEYQQREEDYQRQVAAANLQYEREMAKQRADQAFTAQQNALARGASAAANHVDPPTAALSIISKALGRDGYVSPTTFQIARDAYRQAGGNASDFAKQFWKYTGASAGQKNAGNWKAYYYG